MKVIIFGASGMVGQGVLQECLKDPRVLSIFSVARSPSGVAHTKLVEVLHSDFSAYKDLEPRLSGFDACFYCLGTPSSGKNEAEYRRVTYDFTLAAAATLQRLNPGMIFIYVSGDGADSSEKSRMMWARVRGHTENALFALPFKAVYVFRPGMIQPLAGIESKTAFYRRTYKILGPVLPTLRRIFPNSISSTEILGKAMIECARAGFSRRILTNRDLKTVASRAPL